MRGSILQAILRTRCGPRRSIAMILDRPTFDSAAPLLAGPNGQYPVPQPGIITQREF